MTGLIVASLIIGLIVIIGAITMFMLLPILLAIGGLLALLASMVVASILLLPNFLTLDHFKPQILELLQNATGREISIGGPIGFTVWPVLGLQLNDISIGNPEGARDPIMISAKELGVGVTLSSLMDHKLELRELRLVGAQIRLSEDRQGRANWQFEPKEGAYSSSSASDGAENTSSSDRESSRPGEEFEIKDVNIQSIDIRDADFSFERAGTTVAEVQDMGLKFQMPSLDGTASLSGQFGYRQRQVSFSGKLDQPRLLTTGKSAPLTLQLSAGGDRISVDGDLSLAKFGGNLQASVADLSALAGWASGAPAHLPVRALSLQGQLLADATHADIKGMQMDLDDLDIRGDAGFDWSTARPRLTADLDVSKLNLDVFTGSGGGASSDKPEPAGAPDLSGLQSLNAEVTARLAGVTARNLELGATTAKITLQGGRLQGSLTPASFYGGTITARADVNAGNRSFTGGATLDGVNIEPVLVALNGSSRLTGRGDFTVNVSAPLTTPEAVKRALDGSGRFAFRDGAVKGVNIPALIRRAKATLGAAAGSEAPEGPQQTDFTELTGTFTISDGVVSNQDMRMLSPLVRVTGKGTFSLPDQMVNYRVDSALVADLTGQGGVLERRGLVIPINVRGPVGNLSYTPDLQGLVLGNIGNAQNVGQAIQNLGTKDGQRNTRNAIKGMLGIQSPQPATGTAPDAAGGAPTPSSPPPQSKPSDLLNNLLGGQ